MAANDFIEAQTKMLQRYRVDAESLFVDVPLLNGRAHVLAAGEGPPLMMVIGGGIVAAAWAPLMRELEGHTLYAVDLPGQGLSDFVTHRTPTMRANAVAFLIQVLDALGLDRAHFIGQSMGGQWATWLAADNPERVASISYVGCPAFILGTSAPVPMRLASISMLNRLFLRLDPPSHRQVRRLVRMVGEDPEELDEFCELLLAYELMPGQAEAFGALLHASITPLGPRPEVELTPALLRQVSHPVQFIWGEEDPFGPPAIGMRAAGLMPVAQFHQVQGGHAPWLHHAEEVARHVVRFLSRHADKPEKKRLETQ